MASMSAAAIDLLQREISNPDTQWGLGTFGAIAEFSRDPDEPVVLRQAENAMSAVTARGGIAIHRHPRHRAIASEGITKSGWNQKIALCLSTGRQSCKGLVENSDDALLFRERGKWNAKSLQSCPGKVLYACSREMTAKRAVNVAKMEVIQGTTSRALARESGRDEWPSENG